MLNSPTHRSGFVAVAGKPNVGKSTLINYLLGQKIAAVSPRPQTTRRRQLGILTRPDAQVIFIDTPGLHRPEHKLGVAMNRQAQEALQDADLALFIVEANNTPAAEDLLVAERLHQARSDPVEQPVILVVNKLDLLPPDLIPPRLAEYQALLPNAPLYAISAARGNGCAELLEELIGRLPEGPEFYPEDQITDLYEREIAADLIREAALIHLRDEIPHGIAVRIDEYTERSESGAYIVATMLIEREAHKPILIGQKGLMLKKIGTSARQEIERMSGRKVFLELRVKVRANWRDDENTLRLFGFDQKDS